MTGSFYLGDGLYASFDGYQIWLFADRYGQKHEVALEPIVFKTLVAYAAAIKGGGFVNEDADSVLSGRGADGRSRPDGSG